MEVFEIYFELQIGANTARQAKQRITALLDARFGAKNIHFETYEPLENFDASGIEEPFLVASSIQGTAVRWFNFYYSLFARGNTKESTRGVIEDELDNLFGAENYYVLEARIMTQDEQFEVDAGLLGDGSSDDELDDPREADTPYLLSSGTALTVASNLENVDAEQLKKKNDETMKKLEQSSLFDEQLEKELDLMNLARIERLEHEGC